MEIAYSLEQILALVGGGQVEGTAAQPVRAIASLKTAEPGDLSFLGNLKYKGEVAGCRASLILLPPDYEGSPQPGQAYLRVPKPSLALALVCRELERRLWPKPAPAVHPSAVIAPTAKVSPQAYIGPFCVISDAAEVGPGTVLESHVHLGREARVGENCWLMPRSTVMDYCVVGNRVRLQPGVVLGSDGFGYETINGAHEKVPQIGRVVVEDDVEIGSNTTIDRARFNETRIGAGTKIDNLVQIGHNVIIGRHCLIVAQAGISGSTVLEDYVVLGGQAGLAGHIRIGRGAMIGAQSGVTHDLAPKSYVRDSPAFPYMVAQKIHILKGRLPELFKRVAKVEETLERLQPAPQQTSRS